MVVVELQLFAHTHTHAHTHPQKQTRYGTTYKHLAIVFAQCVTHYTVMFVCVGYNYKYTNEGYFKQINNFRTHMIMCTHIN